MVAPPPWATVHPALRLVRVNNVLVSFAGTAVGGLVARGSGLTLPGPTYLALGLAAASSAMVTAGGNVLNDVLDVEGDRVNHPYRPLVTGAISLRAARPLAAGLLVASLLAILPIVLATPWVGAIWIVAVGALLTY